MLPGMGRCVRCRVGPVLLCTACSKPANGLLPCSLVPAHCIAPTRPQVEATKFTEVGFHGRDVDQIIRDLVDNAIIMMRQVGRSGGEGGREAQLQGHGWVVVFVGKT